MSFRKEVFEEISAEIREKKFVEIATAHKII